MRRSYVTDAGPSRSGRSWLSCIPPISGPRISVAVRPTHASEGPNISWKARLNIV
jgi:hypothetical protein